MTSPEYGSTGDAGAPPVCKNHPSQVTYVRCQRCGEPICPQCTNQAAVGVQCPQCVRSGQAQVRQATTVAGGTVRAGRPIITISIIALCVLMFVAQMLPSTSDVTNRFVFAPVVGQDEPWRFLTAAFLHSTGRIFHIAFNMWALWVLGSQLEFILGRWRFITLYILAALGGSAMVLLLAQPDSSSWFTGTLGASGAIFGLFGALIPVARKLGGQMRSIFGLIAINLVIGFVVPGIAWQAHVGGLLVGLILGSVYIRAPREKRTIYAIGGSVLVAALIVGLVVLKYSQVNAVYGVFG